jgi:L-amino acid N-acyltransferase YncA
MEAKLTIRGARPEDCAAIAGIYNEGIAERRSTFETAPRTAADIEEWLGSPRHPLLLAERGGAVVGWARISPCSPRPCYARVGEGSVYVQTSERGRGVGTALATALTGQAERAGLHKVGQALRQLRGELSARRSLRIPRGWHASASRPRRRRVA